MSNSINGLTEFFQIHKKSGSLLGQILTETEPNKLKWVVRFVRKKAFNLPLQLGTGKYARYQASLCLRRVKIAQKLSKSLYYFGWDCRKIY